MAATAIVDTVTNRLAQASLSELEERARRYVLRHLRREVPAYPDKEERVAKQVIIYTQPG
jgi:hypothetical protein